VSRSNWWNLTSWGAVALKSRTGTLTNPKLIVPLQTAWGMVT